jgi:hypothetical protein
LLIGLFAFLSTAGFSLWSWARWQRWRIAMAERRSARR